ncbi:alpha/beta hydrolase domain-containing protein [Mycobacterium sp. 29Ha]|uniref:alpha/beta hydrolase domain-containing protein n=1 Tax=Mycobacterium sp. 29Ha TaxID=2939268 RepID=UPI002938FAB7|nr:alpha/beta hydrolase domain-containing protein [Mycobacterium sp. 29Ha]MDV3133818.1 alpha/beta hydrolase domain-containing protein [Mycobacterium sp. 29Ha]
MAVESVHVNAVYPHSDTRYEWVEATVDFAVDPELLANERIVDLDLAPRDADGLVRFDADLKLLRPVEGGNGKLLFVVPNRGVPTLAPWLKNGFLLDRGYTIASCGWQWDTQRGSGILGISAPQADVPPGFMRLEWRSDSASGDHPLSFTVPEIDALPAGAEAMFTFTDYPTADVDDPDAVLSVRTSPDAEPTIIPRESWRFTDETHLTLDGGFKSFHWYELVYRTSRAPVAGAGLLAIRDIVSHLRGDDLTAGIQHAFAYGVSQAGRLLRQFISDGLNVDEAGMIVFDGVFSESASAATGEFNHRYAQPSVAQVNGFGNMAPFGATDLLARQRELGGVPKTIFTNSATEYWTSGGALLHVDPVTGVDLPEDPDVRTYLLASTDHFGSSKLKEALPVANPVHRLDVTPVNRALLVALEDWVCEGVEPPRSKVPRTSDGTAVARKEVLSVFSHTTGPDPSALPHARYIDLGPDADRGIGRWPVKLGEPYVDLVSAVDADGNEVAGIRLPAVAAPLASYTGWNPRRHIDELPDVLYERVGSKLAFPPGRPSVTERYPSREDYIVAARTAAESLVAERFLLADEVEAIVQKAAADY